MKKSLFVLAVLAVSCALYAKDASSAEEALAFFAKYNPSVLEKAKQDPAYNAVLQEVVQNVKLNDTLESRLEMIALVRNFDNSVKINTTAQEYENALLLAITSGTDTDPIVKKYRQQFTDAYAGIWAVSVNLQEKLVAQYKRMLKNVKKNTAMTPEQRESEQAAITKKMETSRAYLKQMNDNAGEYLSSAVNSAMAASDNRVFQKISALNDLRTQMQAAAQAQESDNLQVKNKNQKPVAE